MLTRKRIIASAVGALALTAASAGSAWAWGVVNPRDDYYENDHSFPDDTRPLYKVQLDGHDGRTLVIRFRNTVNSNISPFNNDGSGFEKLIGVTAKKGYHGIRYAVKFDKHGQTRLVIHFAKNFTTKFGGRINLRYFVQTRHGIKSARLLFDIGGLCGNVSCS